MMIVFGGGQYKGRLWRFVAMMIHFIDHIFNICVGAFLW